MADAPSDERTVVLEDDSLRQFEGGFTAIPNRVLESNGLTLGARMAYAMLLKYAWQKDFSYPAQERIAQDLGVTDRSVRTFLNELRDAKLIRWKQRGLNKTNLYYILKLPDLTPSPNGGPRSGPENISGPDRKQTSAQDRNQASDKEDPMKKTQVVNALPGNDQKPIPRKGERRPGTKTPSISDRALRASHGFTDEQLAQVHYLVEKQTTLLGAADRNHAHYVKRAAEAVAGGNTQLLDSTLGEFKQAATTIPVKSPPSFFHAMWKEALQKHQGGLRAAEIFEPARFPHQQGFERLSATLASAKAIGEDDTGARIARMLDDAARRGFPIPETIRRSSTYQTVAQWWAALPERAEQGGRSGAP